MFYFPFNLNPALAQTALFLVSLLTRSVRLRPLGESGISMYRALVSLVNRFPIAPDNHESTVRFPGGLGSGELGSNKRYCSKDADRGDSHQVHLTYTAGIRSQSESRSRFSRKTPGMLERNRLVAR